MSYFLKTLSLHMLFSSGAILPFYSYVYYKTTLSFKSHIKYHFLQEVFFVFSSTPVTRYWIYHLRAFPSNYTVNSLMIWLMDFIFYFLAPSALSGTKQKTKVPIEYMRMSLIFPKQNKTLHSSGEFLVYIREYTELDESLHWLVLKVYVVFIVKHIK